MADHMSVTCPESDYERRSRRSEDVRRYVTEHHLGRLPRRFRQKIEVDEDTGCWLWTASKNWKGYGQYWLNGTSVGAHRVAYETLVRPIEPDLQLDHLCRVRHCVNPWHMQQVSCRENLMRGDTIARAHAEATHCPHGHKYEEWNTYISKCGGRICRACWREFGRDSRK